MGERKLGCWVARKRSDSEPLTFSREEMAVAKHMHGQVSDLNTSV